MRLRQYGDTIGKNANGLFDDNNKFTIGMSGFMCHFMAWWVLNEPKTVPLLRVYDRIRQTYVVFAMGQGEIQYVIWSFFLAVVVQRVNKEGEEEEEKYAYIIIRMISVVEKIGWDGESFD